MMVKKFLKFSPVFLLLVVIPSCRSRYTIGPVLNLKNEPLPTSADGSTYTKEQVRKAILEGCRRRGWVAQLKEEGLIEASILVRTNRAKVEIRYDETNISILYKDSENLHYSNGTIHRNYNRWIVYLYRSILKQLNSLT
jgi:hypothetical protein